MEKEIIIKAKDIFNLLRFGESETRVNFKGVENETQDDWEDVTLKVE